MKKTLRCCMLLLFFFSDRHSNAQTQKEANIWYFGRYLGLDFNSGTAVTLNDGQLSTTEGVATICDANGSLLFYTDGMTIYNKVHQVMLNGSGLFGNISSTQSAVIVPKIGDASRYYVFTVDAVGWPNGLTYSIVNMALDNGKGAVELKNVSLQLNVAEKVTAVRHCNNRDVWLMAHGTVSDIYYAFLISPAGISSTPVISHSGTVLPGIVPPSTYDMSTMGCMKASPDGKRIASAHFSVGVVDVGDFDNAAGTISNCINVFLPSEKYPFPYGVEFSPNSNLLYTTLEYTDPNSIKRNLLLQYDVTLGSAAAIRASKQQISQSSDASSYGSLQVAPDGKMYMAKYLKTTISTVNNPNVYGVGCNFTDNAIQFTGVFPQQLSTLGLPTFIQSYFYPTDTFSYVLNCPGPQTNFSYEIPSHVTSVKWNFGDPASGAANNTSAIANPTHIYSSPGTYNVELVKTTNCGTDTLRKQVTTHPLNVKLGPDTLVCGGNSVVLNPSAVGSTNIFVWQDGSTNPSFLATAPGEYWVEAKNNMGCVFRDSIKVDFKPMPSFNLGADKTSICTADTLTLNATVANATSYTWSTGATTPTIKAFNPGTYWGEVNLNGCIFRDSLTIQLVMTSPAVNLGNDQIVCQGSAAQTLDATYPNATYLWQDGSVNPTYTITQSGTYHVTLDLNGCKKSDTVNINYTTLPVFNLGPDKSICAGDNLLLDATVANATSYVWNTGATTPTIKASNAGKYWCTVSRGSCTYSDTMFILSVNPAPVVNLGNDQRVCEGTTVMLDATYSNATYLWQDKSVNSTYTVTKPGFYFVQLDLNGCKKSDTVKINYDLKPVFSLGPDQPFCQGNPITLKPVLDPLWQLSWQDGSVLPQYVVDQPGSYSLTATNQCGSSSDEVVFKTGTCEVYLPSAFTPNGDSKNELFKALGTEMVVQFNLKIFNRYGQIVFETNDKNKGWNGMIKGVASPSGGFTYLLNYRKSDSTKMNVVKGSFLLIR